MPVGWHGDAARDATGVTLGFTVFPLVPTGADWSVWKVLTEEWSTPYGTSQNVFAPSCLTRCRCRVHLTVREQTDWSLAERSAFVQLHLARSAFRDETPCSLL